MSRVILSGALENFRATQVSLTESLRGWTANVSGSSWPDVRFAITSACGVQIVDDANVSIGSPTLLAGPRRRNHESLRSNSLELLDRTSWLLSSGSESWDTFLGGDTSDILAAVSSRFGVSISGAPEIPVYQEDFKLVNGWTPIDRIERVYGGDVTIGSDDVLTFRPPNWTSGGELTFHPSSVVEEYNPAARYSRLYVSKNLGLGVVDGPQYYTFTDVGNVSGALSYPLGPGATPYNEGGVGDVGWVTLWDGPHTSGGKPLGTWALIGNMDDAFTPTPDGTWPATHFTAIVYPDNTTSLPTSAKLKILGYPYDPLPAGVDGAISETYGTGRGAPSPFSDTLIPSKSFADANWAHWLRRANRGTNMLRASGPLNCAARVGRTWSWAPLGLGGRVESVTHTVGSRVPTTEILVNCDEGGP